MDKHKTYREAIAQAAQKEVTAAVVKSLSAEYRWSEQKVRKDIETMQLQIRARGEK